MLTRDYRWNDRTYLIHLSELLANRGHQVPGECWLRAYFCPDDREIDDDGDLVWLSLQAGHRDAHADLTALGGSRVRVTFANGQQMETDDLHDLLEALDRYQRTAQRIGDRCGWDYPILPLDLLEPGFPHENTVIRGN